MRERKDLVSNMITLQKSKKKKKKSKKKGKKPLLFNVTTEFSFKAKSRKVFCQTAVSFPGDGIHRKCGIYACSAEPIYH